MAEINSAAGSPPQKLTKARITGIVMEDILFRSPFYGVIVLMLLGGISFGIVWFILNILRPYIINY